MEFLLNILIIFLFALPLILLEILRYFSDWIDNHHGGLSFIVWIISLIILYAFILPFFNMEPNQNFFRD